MIASHSSARALTNHPRNMTDDMLRAVAKNGGVVQTNFYDAFIDENYRKAAEAQKKDAEAAVDARVAELKAAGKPVTYLDKDQVEREWAAKIARPPLKSLIDHIDHIAKVAGVDHVGLGSDFDGVSGAMPEGIDSAADLAQDYPGPARPRLQRRRYPQDSRRKPVARIPRGGKSKPRDASRKRADIDESIVFPGLCGRIIFRSHHKPRRGRCPHLPSRAKLGTQERPCELVLQSVC